MAEQSEPARDLVPQSSAAPVPDALLGDLRALIENARTRAAQAVNVELTLLHWRIGERIRKDILGQERAEYGERVVESLAKQLTLEYGEGFSRRGLFRMIRFAEVFPNYQIVSTLSAQLSWSHFMEIIPLKDDLKRDFYAAMCDAERWSVRTLRAKINGMLYERTALSKKPDERIRQELAALRDEERMTPDLVFRDPYVLDFLGLPDPHSERDLETAILRELERFLMEMGAHFTFVARQKRLTIGHEDFYIDLLLYHRSLRRLVVIELKVGRFTAAYKGQMELYLRWLDRYDRLEGEEPPIGLILCTEKDQEQIELLQLDEGTIRVAEYLTELPPRSLLEAKLQEAVRLARARQIQPVNPDNDSA